jgi:hypothetical protein
MMNVVPGQKSGNVVVQILKKNRGNTSQPAFTLYVISLPNHLIEHTDITLLNSEHYRRIICTLSKPYVA